MRLVDEDLETPSAVSRLLASVALLLFPTLAGLLVVMAADGGLALMHAAPFVAVAAGLGLAWGIGRELHWSRVIYPNTVDLDDDELIVRTRHAEDRFSLELLRRVSVTSNYGWADFLQASGANDLPRLRLIYDGRVITTAPLFVWGAERAERLETLLNSKARGR